MFSGKLHSSLSAIGPVWTLSPEGQRTENVQVMSDALTLEAHLAFGEIGGFSALSSDER
jgi:hypothetical protein